MKKVVALFIAVSMLTSGCQILKKNTETGNSTITYNTDFKENANFIDSKKSDDFIYHCKIEVNKIPEQQNCTSLSYEITVLPKKADKEYSQINLTCKLNDSIKEFLLIKRRDYFGTDIGDKLLIDRENKGIVTSVLSWINMSNSELDKEKFSGLLEEPLQVLMKWNDGEEYIIIEKENIEVIWN